MGRLSRHRGEASEERWWSVGLPHFLPHFESGEADTFESESDLRQIVGMRLLVMVVVERRRNGGGALANMENFETLRTDTRLDDVRTFVKSSVARSQVTLVSRGPSNAASSTPLSNPKWVRWVRYF